MDLDQLKLKYQSVLNLAKQKGVVLEHVHLKDGKLYIAGRSPSSDVKNDVWNQIKLVDSAYGDILVDLAIDGSLAPSKASPRTYTVVAGDSLWKIAANHLGGGARYPEIIAANPGRLKDEKTVIHPGDVLNLPD